jgi:hypothetical protein
MFIEEKSKIGVPILSTDKVSIKFAVVLLQTMCVVYNLQNQQSMDLALFLQSKAYHIQEAMSNSTTHEILERLVEDKPD